jgi:hypothetical protein
MGDPFCKYYNTSQDTFFVFGKWCRKSHGYETYENFSHLLSIGPGVPLT